MSRLIDIDDSRNCYIGMDGEYETWNIDPNVIAEAQSQRKTGKWILWNYPGEECARCSVCGEEYDQIDLYIGGNDYPKYCPNCGADMRCEDDDIPIEYFENGGI